MQESLPLDLQLYHQEIPVLRVDPCIVNTFLGPDTPFLAKNTVNQDYLLYL